MPRWRQDRRHRRSADDGVRFGHAARRSRGRGHQHVPALFRPLADALDGDHRSRRPGGAAPGQPGAPPAPFSAPPAGQAAPAAAPRSRRALPSNCRSERATSSSAASWPTKKSPSGPRSSRKLGRLISKTSSAISPAPIPPPGRSSFRPTSSKASRSRGPTTTSPAAPASSRSPASSTP